MSEAEIYQPQSISISNSQVSGQVGQAGQDLVQSQTDQVPKQKVFTSDDVVIQLETIERLIQNSHLPKTQKILVVRHIEVAKDEARRESPEKTFAANSLKRAAAVLKRADETVSAGHGVFHKVKPVIESLLPWFGVAKSFFSLSIASTSV